MRQTAMPLVLGAMLFAGCGTVKPLGDSRPVQRVDVVVALEPQIEWVASPPDSNSGGGGGVAAALVGGCLRTIILIPICLPITAPIAIVVESVAYGIKVATRPISKLELEAKRRSAVQAIDLQGLEDALGLEAQLLSAIGSADGRAFAVQTTSGSGLVGPQVHQERTLTLEVRFEKVRALVSPLSDLQVIDLSVAWELTDPLRNQLVDRGALTYARWLSLSLDLDENAKRWVTKNDGRFAEGWETARRDIASSLATRIVPPIAAYSRELQR